MSHLQKDIDTLVYTLSQLSEIVETSSCQPSADLSQKIQTAIEMTTEVLSSCNYDCQLLEISEGNLDY
ncbi:MAG: hypothetical protein AB4041_17300 [Microcystaceae cyanobacterium]